MACGHIHGSERKGRNISFPMEWDAEGICTFNPIFMGFVTISNTMKVGDSLPGLSGDNSVAPANEFLLLVVQ